MGAHVLGILIIYAIKALTWIVIIDCVLTFIPSIDRRNPIVMAIRSITEPIYRLVRKAIPTVRMGDVGFDLSPLIVILALNLITWIVVQILL
jgi:YggT family protein